MNENCLISHYGDPSKKIKKIQQFYKYDLNISNNIRIHIG
ncbi:unnamed protein product [Paramecium octaurelia]|uniref:Uncharacterized protein n=1 Tax=Paramecium octaurelia TaxID=43137 RepID=A0A8S1XKM4_PAROT|nr:unnamed protein product [Paramecium octaurelia]